MLLLLLSLLGLSAVDEPKSDDGIVPFSSGGGGVGERSGVSAVGVGMVVIVRNSRDVFHSGIDRVVGREMQRSITKP